ncbi:phosphate ABC transporter permease subunit PstC [Billgrantia desiderata]|mgnify:CR=1 FL=1|uniref:Phosphate transport system permease protein n=1 Tax=Billgrantia desiderata TaxID=52021 RepID=A0ABS9B780_9GAMM|nr:phosphate ABC transporter permease subunit PstC [Halomonas desiderata]MCE8012182.1 phosphate ABC transporter permease subunit PstC [Halomonas desiderata]MCE8027944.1 phosphate ABC transporter permease subunit PstC [Halomonas desiderata]MCE8043134.1 phosphate ABC transporter permease subunit PstC [Halomonas desiderata]MCE8047769.1 phosphate ABC transporter permease subunit PstC [Halomonas desiderata]OUE46195.1 phosphate ABC transporter permease subunit PstC [Halomonas desiderata SP1]
MNLVLIATVLIVMAMAYQVGLSRSRAVASGGVRLHSRPGYYGVLVALWCGLPALLLFGVWLLLQDAIVEVLVIQQLPAELAGLSERETQVLMRRIGALASGQGVSGEVQAFEVAAAQQMARLESMGRLAMIAAMAVLAVVGLVAAQRRIAPQLRARNHVERLITALLALSSGVAILTTVGIVLSLVGEALHFFRYISPAEFFFGTVWNPRFSTSGTGQQGEFGLLPLLWGTLMVSAIALLVAIPLGLMTAIYMAEYAPPWLRNVAKPIIEVLAGIPTIVYGFFALIVIGPFLSGLGDMLGIGIRATSALTAGLVMGIMIIPFVSSLSDDIITQVPKSLRDGALGLGATKSEMIRQVVLPAALPGIVGAFLLAASRAIGETMIVVLAAGNNPVLHANPFEAISTITVTIVNQLTGDMDFSSPQSLVAFALGLTLFVITLGLNVIALVVVRKYRQQYE